VLSSHPRATILDSGFCVDNVTASLLPYLSPDHQMESPTAIKVVPGSHTLLYDGKLITILYYRGLLQKNGLRLQISPKIGQLVGQVGDRIYHGSYFQKLSKLILHYIYVMD